MSHSLSLKCFACWMVLGAVWSWSPGEAAEPRIYIMTDLEGASGVYKFAQTREPDPQLGERAKEYLMEDIRYVVRGLRAGGATDILVVDGHGSQAFVPHLMEPGAKYLTGQPRPDVSWGLDKSFAGLVQVAAHAMMGTSDGVLCHTQSSRSENRYWYNGVESGELAQCAAIAGHFGVPTIMVTGDEATCREATQFFGPECVTVAVKQGVAREAAVLYPFEETHQALLRGSQTSHVRHRPVQTLSAHCPHPGEETVPDLRRARPAPGRLTTKEGTIDDVLKLFEF